MDSKLFEILMEREGPKPKGIIMERRKGAMFWVKFAAVGLGNLFEGIEDPNNGFEKSCCFLILQT